MIIASDSEIAERVIARTGILTGFFTDADSGEIYLKISIRASSGDIGGFVLGPDGNLLGVVCDSTLTSKDDSSITALSAPDFIAHLGGNGRSGNSESGNNSRSSQSDSDICRFALSTKDGIPNWDVRNFTRNSVNEAKHRGLTPEDCAKLLGR